MIFSSESESAGLTVTCCGPCDPLTAAAAAAAVVGGGSDGGGMVDDEPPPAVPPLPRNKCRSHLATTQKCEAITNSLSSFLTANSSSPTSPAWFRSS